MKKIVIKLGGSSLQDSQTLTQLTKLILNYKRQDAHVVIVHGGGPAINQALKEKNISWQFINGQRQTTPEMMSVIDDVLANQINSQIVHSLNEAGIRSIGLSAADDHILLCTQASDELMQVGKIIHVDSHQVEKILIWEDEPVCVIAPIGFDSSGKKYNINADWAAAQIAIAIDACELVYITDQTGILDGKKKVLPMVTPRSLKKLISQGVIQNGMLTKVNTMLDALNHGVNCIQVVSSTEAALVGINQHHVGTKLIEDLKTKQGWNHDKEHKPRTIGTTRTKGHTERSNPTKIKCA